MLHAYYPLERLPALGFDIHLGRRDEYLSVIANAIRSNSKIDIFNHNLHSLYLYFKHNDIRTMFEQSIVMIDGTSVVWLLRLLGYKVEFDKRMAWIDFIWPLLRCADRNKWRVYYLGNAPDVFTAGLDVIRSRLPRLVISGHHGYFDDTPGSVDNRSIVNEINAFGADLCIVGMGVPREHYWIKRHHRLISAPVMLNAGACLEFVSGHMRTPPRWLGPLGCEWAFRFASAPRRFAFRYLIEPWYVLAKLALAKRRRHGQSQSVSSRSTAIAASETNTTTPPHMG